MGRVEKKDFWHANTYSQFLEERTRPARDLLFSLPSCAPKIIYDLGCGPGNSTILLKDHWPQAEIIGVDSSDNMLALAKEKYPQLKFLLGDIASFAFKEKADIIFSNAALQWLPEHELIIPRLIENINSKGIFAIQIPNNFHSPAHQSGIEILKIHEKWQPILEKLQYGVLDKPLYKVDGYYNLLTQAGLRHIKIWETDYYQEMPHHQAIFDWIKGTGLSPALNAMDEADKLLFEKEYVKKLKTVYPIQANGLILFPYQRLFMVGVKLS